MFDYFRSFVFVRVSCLLGFFGRGGSFTDFRRAEDKEDHFSERSLIFLK
jgi:hypothetical protein